MVSLPCAANRLAWWVANMLGAVGLAAADRRDRDVVILSASSTYSAIVCVMPADGLHDASIGSDENPAGAVLFFIVPVC